MRALVLASLLTSACTFQIAGLTLSDDLAIDLPDLESPPDLSLPVDLTVDDAPPPDLFVPPDLTIVDLWKPDLMVDPCTPAPAPPASGIVALCTVGSPPVLDGQITEWASTPIHELRSNGTSIVESGFSGGQSGRDQTLSGSFRVRWDFAGVYIAVAVSDDQRAIDTTDLWQGDSVEIYLSANGDGTYTQSDLHLVIQPSGNARVYHGTAVHQPPQMGLITATRDVGSAAGWELEVFVPWAHLGLGAVSLGQGLRVDVQLNDLDSGATRQRWLLWRDTRGGDCAECNNNGCSPYCSTSAFDRLQLGGR